MLTRGDGRLIPPFVSWFCSVVGDSTLISCPKYYVQTLRFFTIRNETPRTIQSALHSLSVKRQPCCRWQLNCIDLTTEAKIGH